MSKPITSNAGNRKAADPKPTSIKLTEAQRAVLLAAVERADGVATPPPSMTEKAAHKFAAALVENGLAREVRAKGDAAVWRHGDDGRAYALIVTKLGRGVIEGADHREKADTSGDMAALRSAQTTTLSSETPPAQSERTVPRQGSKLAEVTALLGRPQGVGIAELTSATGWLPHTTRAALTGLRKRGYSVVLDRSVDGASVYRISDPRESEATPTALPTPEHRKPTRRQREGMVIAAA